MSTTDPDAERIVSAGHWLLSHHGPARKADLYAALGLDKNQGRRITLGLLHPGWASQPDRSTLDLTPEGRARFGGYTAGSAGNILDDLTTGWPARHRAMLNLISCAILSRAAGLYPQPAFALIGGTGTGKTSVAIAAAHIFGLDVDQTLLPLPAQTEAVNGRRTPDADAAAGYRFSPAPWTSRALICLDEWDKAPEQARRALLAGPLDTRGRATIEDQPIPFAPVPVLTANTSTNRPRLDALGAGGLGVAVRRRCITLDAGRAPDYNPAALRAVTAAHSWQLGPSQRVPLHGIRLPEPDDAMDEDLEAAVATLTDDGREYFPGIATLRPLALARHALLPAGTLLEVATIRTIADYLTVAESIPGTVHPGWLDTVARWAQDNATLPGVAGLTAAAAAIATERATAQATATTARQARAVRSDQTSEAAAALAEQCRLGAEDIDARRLPGATPEDKATAAGLRKILRQLQIEAAHTSNPTSLDDVRARTAGPLNRAAALATELRARADAAAHHRAQQAAERAQDKRDQDHARQQERARRTQRRQHATAELSRARAQAREWERLYQRSGSRYRDGSPLTVLRAIEHEGHPWLTYVRPAHTKPESRWERFVESVAKDPTPGYWTIPTGLQLPGSPTTCPSLASWGEASRTVLAPLLAPLHHYEDQLCAELGRAPRQRPTVNMPAQIFTPTGYLGTTRFPQIGPR